MVGCHVTIKHTFKYKNKYLKIGKKLLVSENYVRILGVIRVVNNSINGIFFENNITHNVSYIL